MNSRRDFLKGLAGAVAAAVAIPVAKMLPKAVGADPYVVPKGAAVFNGGLYKADWKYYSEPVRFSYPTYDARGFAAAYEENVKQLLKSMEEYRESLGS